MPFRPHIYGAPSGVSKETLQKSSRPAPWANYVASGNLRTQDVYGSEDYVLSRYESAVAAAGEHDIVTLTAQTDGSTTLIYDEATDEVAVSPVAGDGGTTSQVRGVLLDMSIVFLPPTSNALLDGDMTGTWRWYSLPSPELTSPLTLISEEVGSADGIFTPELPSSGWVLLTKGSGSTLGDIMEGSYPSAAMSYVLPSASGFGTRSLLTTSGLSDFAPVLRSSGIGGNCIAQHELRVVSVPLPADVAGQQLLTLAIPLLDHSSACTLTARDAQGAAIATTAGTLANGVFTTSMPLPASAVELRITLATPWVGTVRIGFSPSAATSSLLGYLGIGTTSSLYRWADAQSLTWTYRETLGTPVPCYTGTITTTSYVPGEDTELTPEGQLRPTSRVTVSLARNIETRTVNNQETWSALKKMAYEAAYNGQTMFPYFFEWRSVWDYLGEADLRLPVEQEVTEVVASATYTWYSQSDLPADPPPGVTPRYNVKRQGSVEQVDGYPEIWYRHSLTYANQ